MLSKKSSGYVLVLSAGIAAVLLSLRWFEAKVGTGGFFSGIVVGVVLSFGALFAFIASTQRKVDAIRRERLRVKLPEAPVPGGETAIYHWKVRKLDGTLMSMDDVMRITALRAESSAEAQEAALRALGGHASSLDGVRVALLRERAIHALKSIGVESPARLVDSAIGASRESAPTGGVGGAVLFPVVEPWATAVYGPDILNELEEVVRCFVVLSTDAAVAVALWILHTHAIDAAQITPRLAILSPTKRCGKSTMLKLLGTLVRRPLAAANLTAAGLFRGIDAWRAQRRTRSAVGDRHAVLG